MRIGACLGCRHCRKEPGVCIQKDDMGTVLSALLKADAVALTSPLYYYGVSAQLKLALDRTYAILRRDTSIRRAALLMTCGAAESDAADAAVLMFRKIAALQKWEEAGIVIAPRLHEPEEIKGRPELEQARLLGRKI